MQRKAIEADDSANAKRNLLLDFLHPADRARMNEKLDLVAQRLKEVAYEEGKRIDYVYFPLGSVISLVTIMEDGAAVEVGTIGNEGMVGIPVILGADSSPGRAFVQIPGEALRMRTADFLEELGRGGRFSALMHRYTQYFFIQVAQGTACNRLHPAEERCARWLLQTRDRVQSDTFPLTHEFLAQMLGVRRATVTVIAGALQHAGIIEYRRGTIRILDGRRLEEAACECYGRIRNEYARLFGV